MTDFLAELEAELRTAHDRRHAARRRAAAETALRRLPVAVAIMIAVGGAGGFLAVTAGDHGRSGAPGRSAAVSPLPSEPLLSTSQSPLPRGSVTVLNATGRPGAAGHVARVLQLGTAIAEVGLDSGPKRAVTVVRYAPGFDRQATALAHHLLAGAALEPLDPATRNAARAADIVVEVGDDLDTATTTVRAPDAAVAAGGVVGRIERGGERVVTISAMLPRGVSYAVWTQGDGRPRFAGFATPVTGTRPWTAVLSPSMVGKARSILVTRESTDRPRTPGPVVLAAPIP
jgi:hypothetical protein